MDMQAAKFLRVCHYCVCPVHLGFTFGVLGFLLRFCFLSENHISIFILTFLVSELVLHCVFYFTILIGCCLESAVFSVFGCEHVEDEGFVLFAFESQICHTVIINDSLLSKT